MPVHVPFPIDRRRALAKLRIEDLRCRCNVGLAVMIEAFGWGSILGFA